MALNIPTYRLIDEASEKMVQWARDVHANSSTEFEAAQQLVMRLGAHYRNGQAEFGFWAPELQDQHIPPEHVYLEILTPTTSIDILQEQQEVTFQRSRLNLMTDGSYLWGVVAGLHPGNRQQLGPFYWLTYYDNAGTWHNVVDPLAYSVPYGVKAPSEFYDIHRMQSERTDYDHFSNLDTAPDPDGVPRVQTPTNILQIHVGTASEEQSLEGLTRIYQTIALKRQNGEPLTPAERNYIGYDAVQLMPIEPTIEYEAGPLFWQEESDENLTAEQIVVSLRRPSMTNWGYDIMIAGSPAVNPVILGTGRPDELVDFISTLHNFPDGPIKFMMDIVYGHTDNQSLPVLNNYFFAGANMYGQNLDYTHPVIRAMLIEMQRRKSNFGVDGIRVDGAQDFKWWDEEANVLHHDDDYLELMNNIVQEVGGQRYRPWMIFEDGRPWPRDDWELASTYRVVTENMPNVYQWGPLTFAHNTPFLFTFWVSKWWRIREMAEVGSKWITGCANHDTLRRGTQVDTIARINTYLGDNLPQIFKNGYDNPAAKLFDYAMMPGVPMDFINASMRAPWSFIRNTDDRYGVKVISEEARFLDWAMNPAHYDKEVNFTRLKYLGFHTYEGLRRFMNTLDHCVHATKYNLDSIVRMMQNALPPLDGPPLSPEVLKSIAHAWMDDVYEYCNVSLYTDAVTPERADFNLAVREFRRARPWLREDLREGEHLDYVHPTLGKVVFYGLRQSPEGDEQVLFIANMEGAPATLVPTGLEIPNLVKDGWTLALRSPGLAAVHANEALTLEDSQGVVFTRQVSDAGE